MLLSSLNASTRIVIPRSSFNEKSIFLSTTFNLQRLINQHIDSNLVDENLTHQILTLFHKDHKGFIFQSCFLNLQDKIRQQSSYLPHTIMHLRLILYFSQVFNDYAVVGASQGSTQLQMNWNLSLRFYPTQTLIAYQNS